MNASKSKSLIYTSACGTDSNMRRLHPAIHLPWHYQVAAVYPEAQLLLRVVCEVAREPNPFPPELKGP